MPPQPTQQSQEDIRRQCRKELDEQAHNKDINVNHMIHFYREKFAEEPILRLLQDINQRVGIYSNIIDEIKRIRGHNVDVEASTIKAKYEELGLVQKGQLPNPTAASIAEYILEKLSAFGRAVLKIMSSYGSELARELRFELTMMIEVEVAWLPKVSIGVEVAGSLGRADARQ
jgi:hypothetical protein